MLPFACPDSVVRIGYVEEVFPKLYVNDHKEWQGQFPISPILTEQEDRRQNELPCVYQPWCFQDLQSISGERSRKCRAATVLNS